MELRLDQVSFADGHDLAVVQREASATDIFYKALHSNASPDRLFNAAIERWSSNYAFGPWYYLKVTDTVAGQIIAFSRWAVDDDIRQGLPPRTGIPEGLTPPPRRRPSTLNMALVMGVEDQRAGIEQRLLSGRKVLSLDTICIHPRYQGLGGAQDLMLAWATGFADQHSLLCYAEQHEQEFAEYSKHGFQARDHITATIDGSPYVLDCLLREPRSTSS